jgi:hypothetical protein
MHDKIVFLFVIEKKLKFFNFRLLKNLFLISPIWTGVRYDFFKRKLWILNLYISFIYESFVISLETKTKKVYFVDFFNSYKI